MIWCCNDIEIYSFIQLLRNLVALGIFQLNYYFKYDFTSLGLSSSSHEEDEPFSHDKKYN